MVSNPGAVLLWVAAWELRCLVAVVVWLHKRNGSFASSSFAASMSHCLAVCGAIVMASKLVSDWAMPFDGLFRVPVLVS